MDATAVRPESAFKLLESYSELDSGIFAGRSREISEIVSRVVSHPIVVLYGPSGSGKTSLLRAGLFPRLAELGWCRVYVRTLTDPLVDLDDAIGTQLGATEEDLVAKAHTLKLPSAKPTLICFDQFEEFFIRFGDDQDTIEKFVDLLKKVLDSQEADCRIIFCLREDYLARMDGLSRLNANIFGSSYRVRRLSAYGAREAVIAAFAGARVGFESRVVATLVDSLAEYDFDPVILQVMIAEVASAAMLRNREEVRVSVDDLASVGTVRDVFERYLRNAMERIAPEQHLLTRLILDAFISHEKTKQAMRVADLLARPFIASEEEVTYIVAQLAYSRLIKEEKRGEQLWYELVHERLVDLVGPRINADAAYVGFLSARDLIENCYRSERWRYMPQALISKGQLEDVIGPYESRLRLHPSRIELLVYSGTYFASPRTIYWLDRLGSADAEELLLRLAKHI